MKETIGYRILKVFMIIAFGIAVIVNLSAFLWTDNHINSGIQTFFYEWFISLLPIIFILIISTIQYIIWGIFNPFFTIKNKMVKKIIIISYIIALLSIFIKSIDFSSNLLFIIKFVFISAGIYFLIKEEPEPPADIKKQKDLFKKVERGEILKDDDYDIVQELQPNDAIKLLKINEKNIKRVEKYKTK